MNPFDTLATRYDGWFETPEGRSIFSHEIACLRDILGKTEGRWLEVGVGTGRFAQALGIGEGIDPSAAVLSYASDRGVQTRVGRGEDLPYSEGSLDGILMVVTICFLDDPARALEECRRTLRAGGRLVVGLVPADSEWGQLYARQAQEGHDFYSVARFYTCDQIVSLADAAGLAFADARSCLFTSPGEPANDLSVREGIVTDAGFVALQFARERDNDEMEMLT